MKVLVKVIITFVFSLILITTFIQKPFYAASGEAITQITAWEMSWSQNIAKDNLERTKPDNIQLNWFPIVLSEGKPNKPVDVSSAWLRFQLPQLDWARPAMQLSKLTAKDVTIYIDNQIIYQSDRKYPYYKNEILLPLTTEEANKFVYIQLTTTGDWLGLEDQISIGEYNELSQGFMKRDMLDVILGVSLIFIALAMLIGVVFLKKYYLAGWNSLCAIILSLGIMILTYSPFIHIVYRSFGFVSYYLFDVVSTIFMASIFIFFERIFGKGNFGIISKFKNLQIIMASINIMLLLFGFLSEKVSSWHTLFGTICFGVSIILGNVIIFGYLVYFCKKGNKEAKILTIGFGTFAGLGATEVIWFFIKGMGYDLFYWKWGILFFIASLVIIVARRILQNYDQVVKYSEQLEVFNNELQRSEKMEIISQLAASVAHEVRNPLQVTRGFLQLLGAKSSNDKDKSFMLLAIDELDRASEIITDFLTFAKPQIEQTTILNIAEEIHKIEGILVPLATMQGGIIKVNLGQNLYVRGNSSKFKQALINIIKNSIESLGEEGTIVIDAFYESETKQVIISIKDNGEGMHEGDIQRLGEPYYSKKSKGTGLGLMVTFRIIEVMQGDIHFKSKKGVGTEAIIQLPSGI
jgi:two-component system sporulation sensor kinase B